MSSTTAQDWGNFLSAFHWQAFATLTFKTDVTTASAARAVQAWRARLPERAYGYVVFERVLPVTAHTATPCSAPCLRGTPRPLGS